MNGTEELTGTIPSGDVNIFYRKTGHYGKIPICILHGLSFYSYDWIPTARRLGADREVVAIDLRGFGESSWSKQKRYGLSDHVNDVRNVLDHFGWSEAILIGHSYGGRVCLMATDELAGRVSAYVSIDFSPDLALEGRRRVAEQIGRQPDVFMSVDDALSYHGHRNVGPGSPIRLRFEKFLRRSSGGYVLLRDPYYRESFRRSLDSGQYQLAPPVLWELIGRLGIPSLIVRGADSDLFARETLEKISLLNSGIRLVEIEGGHDLARDNPDGLIGTVQAFLHDYSI